MPLPAASAACIRCFTTAATSGSRPVLQLTAASRALLYSLLRYRCYQRRALLHSLLRHCWCNGNLKKGWADHISALQR
jgi:hypothetical protein